MEQQRRPRRSFPDEYKAEVIELCRTSGKSIAAVARDLDLSEPRFTEQTLDEPLKRGRRKLLGQDGV